MTNPNPNPLRPLPPTEKLPTSTADPTADLRAYLLSSWDVCRELNRNELLEIIRNEGGVCPMPTEVDDPSGIQLFVTLGRMMIDAFTFVEHCSAGLWLMYVDVPSKRFTFAPKDVLVMAIEQAIVDRDRLGLVLR